jgi:predicted nucleic-acid-binding Zn-ribbon protein
VTVVTQTNSFSQVSSTEAVFSRPVALMRNNMKNSKACPKCRSTETIRIPGQVRAFGAGNNISVGATIFSSVRVTRYLCASCGFSEEWIDSPDDIAAIKKKYALSNG